MRFLFIAVFTLLVLFSPLAVPTRGAITSLNLFKKNDYDTCTQGAPDQTISITGDGNCHTLVEARPDLELDTCYYATYTDTYTGVHSAAVYSVETLAVLERCDCEYITSLSGNRAYNRTCLIARLNYQCSSFKNNGKTKRFWNKLYDDKELKFWGVDVEFQHYLLY
jgi:hypothetical protein